MRAKRSKKYRKIMASYGMHFSFRTPYQVLCNSSFLRQCHAFHMPVQKSLENTLHGDARPYITQCSLARAIADHKGKGRGDGKPMWLPPPTEVPLRYCKHKDDEGKEIGVIDEAECLVDLVGGQPKGNETSKNKNHYVLATAEEVDEDDEKPRQRKKGTGPILNPIPNQKKRKRGVDVREAARQIPGVPIIYVKRSVMVLEELSGASERVIRTAERAKFKDGLVGDTRGTKRKREDGDDSDDDSDAPKRTTPKTRGPLGKAKGPNPLSVRKKKVKATVESGSGAKREAAQEEGASTGQKRKRRRTHGKKGDGGQDGGIQDGKIDSVSTPAQTNEVSVGTEV